LDRSRRRQEALGSPTPPSAAGGVAQAVTGSQTPAGTVVETLSGSGVDDGGRWFRGRFRTPSGRGPRLGRRTRALLVAVLVVVAGSSWSLDQHRRNAEFSTLLAAVRQGQATIGDCDRRVASMIEYVSPLLHAERTPPDVRAGLQQVVHTSALQAAARLRTAAQAVAAISVLPWHTQQAAARDAYAADLNARAAYYELFLAPGMTGSESAQAAAVRTGWAAARTALMDAATDTAEQSQAGLLLTQ
jgi:hypothetical protein